jgi:hypothetical protein
MSALKSLLNGFSGKIKPIGQRWTQVNATAHGEQRNFRMNGNAIVLRAQIESCSGSLNIPSCHGSVIHGFNKGLL